MQVLSRAACSLSSGDCALPISEAPSGEDLSSTTSAIGTTSYQLRGVTTAPYPFIEYLPGGYADNASKAWPLIVMLHGIGEEGQGSTVADLSRAGVNGPNRRIREGRQFPAVILTPQAPSWWDNNAIRDFITFALAHYRINPHRIYVTGLSMGGAGAWGAGVVDSARVAAIVPIAGAAGADPTAAANMMSNHLSVWAFHNQDDGTVAIGNSDSWMNAFGSATAMIGGVRDANPTGTPTQTAHMRTDHAWEWRAGVSDRDAGGFAYAREVHYTVYPSGGHDSWTVTYANDTMWDWLFRQYRN